MSFNFFYLKIHY